MDIPESMLPFLQEGRALWKEGKVGEVLFSGRTYQVEILTGKASLWTFLQFDESAHLVDAFCTCETSEKKGSCAHLAASFLRIYNHTEEPLHIRFKASLWYQLFFMAAKRHGYEKKVLKKGKKGGYYFCQSKTKKRLFSIEAKTKAAIEKVESFLAEKPLETEETSLKFSTLSAEEIALYKKGEAAPSLRFELSFWSDLAKWMMILQEMKEPYTIEFFYSEEKVPHEIQIDFAQVQAFFYIPLASLPSLIPSLATVQSPLPIYEEDKVQRITYDSKKEEFHIHFHEKGEEERKGKEESISLGEWEYVSGKGFYKKSLNTLLPSTISREEIARTLTQFSKTFAEKLQGAILHTEPIKAKYFLFFDEGKNLHIQCYVEEEGDLFQEGAGYFHPWAFLPREGFYRLEETFIDAKEKVIPKEEVGDFVTHHRVWLHGFEGFQTHFGHFESHLSYTVTEQGELRFSSNLDLPDSWENAVDFGSWIYLEGQGFYMKHEGREIFTIWPGFSIKKEEVSSFISRHTDELFSVQGFFSARCPIEKRGLSLQVEEGGRIKISPLTFFAPNVDGEKVRFFGDYTYVEGEGFFFLPGPLRLPEGYREEKTIPVSEEAFFLTFEIDRLKPFILEIDPRLQKPSSLQLKVRKLFREKKLRRDFWIVDLFYESELGIADAVELWQAIIDKKKYLYSAAGLISLKAPRFNWLRYLGKRRMHRRIKLLKLTTIEWIRLSILEDLRPPSGDSLEAQETRKFFKELESLESTRLLQITKLKATLRPYQELGLSWLWHLYCYGLSGLLADEMGLGKTHQAMALLAAISEQDEKRSFKYLVICPTSVIYHWQELLRKFLPEIRVCTYYGLARSLADFSENYDLLLTSYGILRTGKESLKEWSFELAIFDEIQIAKNHRSQTHLALREIEASMKLGLTGTPIENRLRELKALFDLVLPQYLPPENIFRELFIAPIEKYKDPEKKALLHRLVKPFILRRKKSEVLLDLPEKMEEISYCDLSEEQKALYQEASSSARKEILSELTDLAKPPAYMHVFALLLKLKQICDHPSLVLGDVSKYTQHTSGKWELFVELLNEARESEQKVVVFSQFLPMLAIIEAHLKKKGIGFAGIKGSTKNRQEEIRRFREDPECKVFVASLLAAGVGIDLSCASVVIHYDRWWNPAKENQATDRVHRIGQNRGVQVFKLVTKHTIEEHIHDLIERKKGLIEEAIGKDDSDQIRFLTREELIDIVQKTSELQ